MLCENIFDNAKYMQTQAASVAKRATATPCTPDVEDMMNADNKTADSVMIQIWTMATAIPANLAKPTFVREKSSKLCPNQRQDSKHSKIYSFFFFAQLIEITIGPEEFLLRLKRMNTFTEKKHFPRSQHKQMLPPPQRSFNNQHQNNKLSCAGSQASLVRDFITTQAILTESKNDLAWCAHPLHSTPVWRSHPLHHYSQPEENREARDVEVPLRAKHLHVVAEAHRVDGGGAALAGAQRRVLTHVAHRI